MRKHLPPNILDIIMALFTLSGVFCYLERLIPMWLLIIAIIPILLVSIANAELRILFKQNLRGINENSFIK